MARNSTTQEMKECGEICLECYTTCTETLSYCLEQGGEHVEAPHVTLLQDCIEICRTSADFLLRGSSLHATTCAACAEICERCAEDCARIGGEEMDRCAEVCRRCAESCRQMSGARA
jgi:hypothetical protein